jgi:ATP-dependent DNA ligase
LRWKDKTATSHAAITGSNQPNQARGPFDDGDQVFEAKFDGFRAAADAVRGRSSSRNGGQNTGGAVCAASAYKVKID